MQNDSLNSNVSKRKTMDIKPNKTEADCNAALKNIEQFWDANYGSPEGGKLDEGVIYTTLQIRGEEI